MVCLPYTVNKVSKIGGYYLALTLRSPRLVRTDMVFYNSSVNDDKAFYFKVCKYFMYNYNYLLKTVSSW